MFGTVRMSATSSIAWCETPRIVVTPGRKPTNLTDRSGYAACIVTWSKHRFVTKAQKLCTKGISPDRAMPPASPTMFASAMPTLWNRSGKVSRNRSVSVGGVRSAERHTMRGSSRAAATSASP